MASSTLLGLDALDTAAPTPRDAGQTARKAWSAVWPKLAALAMVWVIWELIHVSGWKKYVFPGPGVTLSNLWDQVQTGLFWRAVETTLQRALLGYALALVIGVVVGSLVSRNRALRSAVGSLITGLQLMPSLAWFPFAIILFGITTQSIIFVIVLAAAPSIANSLIAGVDYTPPLMVKAGKMMGLRRLSLHWHLFMPASLPTFVAGLKQAWAFAFHALIAGELLVIIANRPSLGVLLSTDQDQADMTSVVAIMITILIIGILVDGLFGAANRVIRRRYGLEQVLLQNSCSLGVFAREPGSQRCNLIPPFDDISRRGVPMEHVEAVVTATEPELDEALATAIRLLITGALDADARPAPAAAHTEFMPHIGQGRVPAGT